MSLFLNNRKRLKKPLDDELITTRTEISSGGEAIDLYGDPDQPEINRRYRRASVIVGILKYIALTAFFIFFMFMTVTYSSLINTENFRYILKDLNLRMPTGIEEYGNIYYTADMEQSFGIYRDDFVCVGRSAVEVIDMTGKKVQDTQLRYVKPRLVTSEKYMLVYDLSNTQYSIYDSFSLVHSATLEHPISCADINDNGYYLIVSRDEEYKSIVYVYNKEMKNVYTYKSNDRYVFDCRLDNNGDVTLYTSTAKNGDYVCQIIRGNIKEETAKTVFERTGEMMLKAYKTSDTDHTVLCADTLLFFKNTELVSEFGFWGRVCRRCAGAGGNTAAVLSSEGAGAECELIVFDSKGDELYRGAASADISELYVNEKSVYLIYTGRIIRVDIATGNMYVYVSGYEAKGIVTVNSEIILVATSSSAYPVSVYDDFEKM